MTWKLERSDSEMIMHIPVLLSEVIEGLDLHEGETVVDGTVGEGGHSVAIAEHIGLKGKIIGLDLDQNALDVAHERLEETPIEFHLIRGNFRNIDDLVQDAGIEKVDKILLDVGLRSAHIDTSGRGFSFRKDEPLLMTFSADPSKEDVTAYIVVNDWEEENLADIIYGFGGERYSRRIARAIVERRREKKIETSKELADIVYHAVPHRVRRGRIHPATRTFQAIRMAVNDELNALKEGLVGAKELLVPGGRIAVISFHSLEDRVVKKFGRDQDGMELLTQPPTRPTEEEVQKNPRSRSALLRILQKIS